MGQVAGRLAVMPILKKDPEKEAAKQAEAERLEQEKARADYAASPVGQAEAAHADGRLFFQLKLDIDAKVRVPLLDTHQTKDFDPTQLLEQIEAVGWSLESAQYLFRPTGEVSRDKLLSSGQTTNVSGNIVGVYLFRRRS
jgi:hypothetical protein